MYVFFNITITQNAFYYFGCISYFHHKPKTGIHLYHIILYLYLYILYTNNILFELLHNKEKTQLIKIICY